MTSYTGPPATSTLVTFPLELLQLIATHLPTLHDILTFSTISHRFYSAVNSDNTVYRHIFHRHYDPPIPFLTSPTLSLASSSSRSFDAFDYKSAFIGRHLLLRSLRTSMHAGRFTELLQLIRTLLLESPLTRDSRVGSKNLTTVIPCSLSKPILTSAMYLSDPQPKLLLLALQLLLLPIRGHGDSEEEVERARRMAYADGKLEQVWLDLRMLNAVGVLQMRHLYMKSSSEPACQRDILEKWKLPGWWEGRLGDMLLPGKGGEEELRQKDVDEEVPVERDDDNEEEEEDDHDVLQDMPTRWFGSYSHKYDMPDFETGEFELFEVKEDCLSDLRLEFRNRRFKGTGKDYTSFVIDNGTIGDPVTIEGIPGWRKVRFMKSYQSHAWRYVGCMLPGKNVIIGRTGYPGYTMGVGTFMLWAVPEDIRDLST